MTQSTGIVIAIGAIVVGVAVWFMATLFKKGVGKAPARDDRSEMDKLLETKNKGKHFR